MSETLSEKQWDDAMGEISGFGGGYEAVCRAMVLAGIKWVDENPEKELSFKGLKEAFGFIMEDSDGAKEMVEAMMSAPVYLNGEKIQEKASDDCTGAMHHAACSHVLAYKRLGWDEYRRQLCERGDE